MRMILIQILFLTWKDLTAGAKVVTGAVRTAKARGTMVTREAR